MGYNVLFICDNDYLYRQVLEFVSVYKECRCTFVRSACKSSSYMACDEKMPALDVNSEYQQLIGTYDVIFTIHCKQLLPGALVRSVRCFNVHPGYNPYNRGWFPQVFGLINHLSCGATIHEIDEELDHGAIICQEKVEVFPWDTSRSVYDRVLATEMKLFKEHFWSIVVGTYQKSAPCSEGNLNMKTDFRKLCQLDLNEAMTLGQAIDRLRALTHPPYTNAFFIADDGTKVKVSITLTPETEG